MKIVIVGTGNVAHNLSFALKKKAYNIVQIVGRTASNTKELATKLHTRYTIDIRDIDQTGDLYFLAVNDSSISEIIEKIKLDDQMIIHLSGSISIDVFNGFCKNFGVLYPLQTLRKEKIIDFTGIPICVESNTIRNLDILKKIASDLSSIVFQYNSKERKILHLSAVFASNYVNHLFSISQKILNDNLIDWDILKPLITETVLNALENNPEDNQTGPAIRKDYLVLNKHYEMLKNDIELLEIYNVLGKHIINYNYKKNRH